MGGVADSQTGPKPHEITPKIAFFDPNFTFRFPKSHKNPGALLLALALVELQNTCKKKLNRKMLERSNICYIFEKLRVQGCQI